MSGSILSQSPEDVAYCSARNYSKVWLCVEATLQETRNYTLHVYLLWERSSILKNFSKSQGTSVFNLNFWLMSTSPPFRPFSRQPGVVGLRPCSQLPLLFWDVPVCLGGSCRLDFAAEKAAVAGTEFQWLPAGKHLEAITCTRLPADTCTVGWGSYL